MTDNAWNIKRMFWKINFGLKRFSTVPMECIELFYRVYSQEKITYYSDRIGRIMDVMRIIGVLENRKNAFDRK